MNRQKNVVEMSGKFLFNWLIFNEIQNGSLSNIGIDILGVFKYFTRTFNNNFLIYCFNLTKVNVAHIISYVLYY